MNHRTLAPTPAKPVPGPVATGALQRPGVSTQDWSGLIAEREESGGAEQALMIPPKHRPAPPPATPPEPPRNSARPPCDFAQLNARTLPENIHDADAARAFVTRLLIEELAPRLGLDPRRIDIHADDAAERRANGQGAKGLQEGNILYLHPREYRPESRAGRYLLAHEAAHAVQRGKNGWSRMAREDIRAGVVEAEAEADRIGRAFASRETFSAPERPLTAHSLVAETGAHNVEIPAQQLDAQRKELDALVVQTHRSELARMIDLLSYGFLDWAITDEDVRKVLDILQTLNMVGARSLVAALPWKYRRRLLDNLDTHHYKHYRAAVLAVYWGSSEAELKSFSGEMKSAFESMEIRLLDRIEAAAAQYAINSIDPSTRKALQTGRKRNEIEVILTFAPDLRDESRLLEEALEQEKQLLSERAKAEKAFTSGKWATALQQLVKLIKSRMDDKNFRADDAVGILKMLMPYAHLKSELRAIADHLIGVKVIPSDNPKEKNAEYEAQFDYLEKLIRFVPVDLLYVDARFQRVFFTLLTFRPAYKNAALAERLTDSSRFRLLDLLMKVLVDPFTDRVTSEEAYLAFLLVKAMPPHTRKAFFGIHQSTPWWRKLFFSANDTAPATVMMDKLSQQQRETESFNFYSGGKEDADRNALLSQLLNDEVWEPQGVGRLEGLVRMAVAAGHHEFVFSQSEQRQAHARTWLKPLVDKYRLYDPDAKIGNGKGRTRYSPEILKGTSWYTRGWLFGGVYQGAQGIDFIASSNNVELATKSIGGEGLNLVELQDLFGGNFMGARFKDFSELGPEGKAAREKKAGVNFANVKWDTRLGILTMDAPKLEIDAIHYPVDDFKFQSGRGTLNSLQVELHYSTAAKPEPSLIDVAIGDLTLHDVALIKPDAMKTVNTVGVSSVRVYAGASGSDAAKLASPRSGLKTPVPIIGIPLGGAWNLFLGSLWNGLAGIIGANPKAGIGGSAGELAENLMKPAEPMEFRFSFGSLKLVGVTTSGGQFVESVELKDLMLRGGGDANSYRNALRLSQDRISIRLAKGREQFGRAAPEKREQISREIIALEKQRTRTQAELDALAANEKRVRHLEKRQQQSPQSFTPEDRKELRRLKAQLTGAVLDVGSVSIKGIAGLGAGAHTLTNVHGQGRSANAALGLLMDSDKIKNLITGEAGRPVIRSEDSEQDVFTLDIGHVELPPIHLKGAIPKAEDARKDFEKFLAKHEPWRKSHQEELARLEKRWELAARREALLENPGIAGMSRTQQAEFRLLERELDRIEAQAQLTIGRVVIDGATLSITGNERIAVGADELLVQDVSKGDLRIQQITGSNVQVGIDVRDGVAALDEWRKNLKRLGIKGGSVIVTGIKNEEIGLQVDRATLMGIEEASLDVGARNASARLTTKLVLVEGVRLRNFEELLIKERDYLKAKPDPTPKEKRRLDAVQAELDGLAKLRQDIADAEVALSIAKTKKQKQAAQDRRDQTQARLDRWAEGLVAESLAINDLDVDVFGLGDILSEAYDPASALEGGIEIKGRGGPGGKRIFSSAVATNVGIPGLSGSRISLGETGGRVVHSKAGTQFDGIHIDTIAAQGIDWHGGQHHAFSRGETRLQGIDVTAFVGEEHILISTLNIGAILADQVGYEDEATGLRVLVESGGLGGIHVTNLRVALPQSKDESAKITGMVVAESLTDLKVNALIKGIRAKGTLNGSNLTADFVTDRKRVFSIGELNLKGGQVIQPGTTNNIHVAFNRLKGVVTQEDLENGETKYTLSGIALGDLTVGRSRWAGGGNTLEVNGQAFLRGVTLDAEVLQGSKEPDGKGGTLKELKIVRLGVAQITATDVRYWIDAVPADPKKPDDKGSKSKDVTLEKATILGLELTGIDLMKDVRNMTGQVRIKDSIDIQNLRIAVGDAGKDQIVTTLSVKAFGKEAKDEGLHGRELRATLFGAKGAKIELGTIQEITGDFEGLGAKTSFATGQITMSPIEISGGGTEAKVADVEIKGIQLTAPSNYKDGEGTEIKLASANVTAVHIKNVIAKFGEVTDKDGKKSQGMTNLDISGLKFDFIGAKGFNYTGKTTISSSETKTNTIKAEKAELTELVFDSLTHDFTTRITKLDARLAKSSVTGFAATFAETIAGKTSQLEVFGNIEAGSMHAMLTLTGTKALGEDWTSIDGLFELTDPARGLGLTNARIVHTDAGGKKLEVGVLDPKKTGGFDLTGLKVKFAPNGTLFAQFDELAGKNLKLKAGGATVEIPLAKLKKGALGMEGLAPGQAFDVLGAKLQELEVQGIKVTYEVDRSAPATPGKPGAASAPWVLDALKGLDGTLNVRARGTAVGNVSIPAIIRSGSINFDNLTGDDGYFLPGDIWFFVSKRRIWARHFKIPETLYESNEDIPGVSPAIIEYTEPTGMDDTGTEIIITRGQLNLKEFLEGTLNKKSSGSGTPAEPLDKLNTLDLTGTLDVGDGVIGTSQDNVTLTGKGAGKNRISISGASLGSNLTIAMPEFQASKGKYELFGKPGETGQINVNMTLAITGLGSGPDATGHLKFTLTLTVVEGFVREIKFGRVALASEAAMRARPAPPEQK